MFYLHKKHKMYDLGNNNYIFFLYFPILLLLSFTIFFVFYSFEFLFLLNALFTISLSSFNLLVFLAILNFSIKSFLSFDIEGVQSLQGLLFSAFYLSEKGFSILCVFKCIVLLVRLMAVILLKLRVGKSLSKSFILPMVRICFTTSCLIQARQCNKEFR